MCLGRLTRIPNALCCVFIRELVEDPVGTHRDEVVVLRDLERCDVWICLDYIRVTSPELQLCLWVPKCAANRKSSWQYADRPYNILQLVICCVFDLGIRALGSCSLVNLAATLHDSLVFINIGRLVISAQRSYLLTAVRAQDSSRIANISHVTDFSHDQNANGTASRSLRQNNLPSLLIAMLTVLQELMLGFFESIPDSLLGIRREGFLTNNIGVQFISEEFCAG